jgi:3',5'-nucleoside bisphosphate phosphatase
MRADLHLHTTESDGRLTPAQMVALAAKTGLDAIAITDHDTINGVIPALEAARSTPSLMVIPGIELSTDVPEGEIHVLGYFINFSDEEFVNALNELGDSRHGRAEKMVQKLNGLGKMISFERVKELAQGSSIGRPHVAQALLESGFVSTEKEAFDLYIGHNKPAYVERKKMLPSDAVKMIRKAGGLPVLAHPSFVTNIESVVAELKGVGLAGIEACYPNYARNQTRMYNRLANTYKLITTGGTDYHALNDGGEAMIGSVLASPDAVKNLLAAASPDNLNLIKQYR